MKRTKNSERLEKLLNSEWAAEEFAHLVEQDARSLGIRARAARKLGADAARIFRQQAEMGKPVVLVRDAPYRKN